MTRRPVRYQSTYRRALPLVAGTALFLTGAGGAAHAQAQADQRAQPEPRGSFGAGIILGEPTGLTFKTWLNNNHAVDLGLAWSFSENDSFQIHADYLIHDFETLRPVDFEGRMGVYYGLGGRIKFEEENGRGRNDDDTLVGVRVPLGVTYEFPRAPVELFGEFVPVLDLSPDTDLDINLAIGARVYFF